MMELMLMVLKYLGMTILILVGIPFVLLLAYVSIEITIYLTGQIFRRRK